MLKILLRLSEISTESFGYFHQKLRITEIMRRIIIQKETIMTMNLKSPLIFKMVPKKLSDFRVLMV